MNNHFAASNNGRMITMPEYVIRGEELMKWLDEKFFTFENTLAMHAAIKEQVEAGTFEYCAGGSGDE